IAGPDIPQGLVCADSPGAMMPNGKILFSAAPPPTLDGNNNPVFPTPTSFFEYDYSVGALGAYTQVPGPTDGTDGIPSFQSSMLVLPDGSILYNHWKGGDAFYSSFGNQLHVYVPDAVQVTAGKPIIENITPNGDGTFHLVGYNLNGISEGACYGDDIQPHSNYPIIQFKDTNNAHVDYGRTFNWTGTGIYTGTTSTEFSLPAGLIPQTYLVQVSANGILSDPVVFSFVNPSSLALCPGDSGTLSGFASPQPTSYQWLFNGFAIPGQTSLQLHLNSVTTNQSGYYTLRATTSGWPVDSLPVPVSVGEWVVSQPPVTNSATICGSTTLTVAARGKGILSPHWLFNGKPIVFDARVTNTTTALANGATRFQLQISDVHYTDDGFYSVAITDDCGTNTTSAFALRVTPNPAWVLTATTGPPSRYKAAGAYDSTRHVTVLFGGQDPNLGLFGDTWEYNGTNWLQRFPTNAPQERCIAQMVYDPFRQKCVLFGGQIVSNNTYVMSHETWEWDGANWQKIVTANTPANWTIADSFAACFDSAHGGEMLIYGGTAPAGKLNEFWGYDGTNWVQKHPNGPTPAVPNTPFMAFDSARSVAVLFGAVPTNNPYAFQEVWEWNGLAWTNKPVSGQQFGGVLIYDNLTYDTVRHECILYGAIQGNIDGVDSINLPYPDGYRYIWRWNGQQWQADPATPTPGIKDFQLYATFCFDSYRNAAVIYGGSGNSSAVTNFTYELVYADTPVSLQQTTTQIALLGQTVQLSVLTAGAPPVAFQWLKGSSPLSDTGNITGTTSNLLSIHVTSPGDAGTYQLNMVNQCGAASSRPILLNVVAGQMVVGVSSGHPVITWNNPTASLQSSINVLGPWTTINGATSPYQVTSPAGTVFFRLIQ
ncbi:MAG: immunoglobulin domain-containing protein, partial [Limisphaerales bacterium]